MTADGWSIVYESRERRDCADRQLLFTSLAIPHELLELPANFAILVPDGDRERALYELQQFEQENRPRPSSRPTVPLPPYRPMTGVVLYVLVICLFAWLTDHGYAGVDWQAAGRVDGELMRNGEWWRGVTALTLHGSLRHLLGNIGFGALFGLIAGRVTGGGVAWLAIVVAAGLANTLNTMLLAPAHRSLGASTAVFAALGLAAGFVWRGRLMPARRWPYRLGPVIGGIALLAYTGTGDEGTDIGAHLAGFLCGFGGGLALTPIAARLDNRALQLACGALAMSLVAGAWWLALRV